MKRFPRTSSPSNLSVFTSCLLSFLMLLSPVATLAGSVKLAEAADAHSESQRKLTADQRTEAFLFGAPLVDPTPDVSATMTDSIADADADNKAEFGETITYTADIKNDDTTVSVDATGVTFNAALDPNTEFVPGSVKVSPLAFNDAYVATKDTPLTGAPSLLANDTGQPTTPTLVVSGVVGCADLAAPFENCATTLGGEVDVNADGTFTYTPQTGDTGADSFQYTISNGVTPPNPGVDDQATATINIDAAPEVTATTPADNAVGINPTANIEVTFSEPVNVTGTWFTISCTTSGTHTATVTGGPTIWTLDPDTNFVGDETCTVTIVAAQVTDQDSNDPPDNMAADYVFDFTTDAAPEVTTTSPANGDTGVTTDANIIINFSESVTHTASAFKIECPAPGNLQTFVASGSGSNQITLNPSADLPAGVTCTVTVDKDEISDSDAFDPPNNLEADYVFSFTTDAAPAVLSTTPADNATNLATNTTIQINFSENVNATTSSFKIECPIGSLQPFTLSPSPSNTFTLTPSANLPGGTTCTVTVIALQISDQDGNDPPDKMVADYVFDFTTDAAPSVTATSPLDNATKVANNTNVVITFSEPVTVNGEWFSFNCTTSLVLGTSAFTVTPNGTNTVFTLDKTTDYANGEQCVVTINAAQVEDTDSFDPPNNLTANYVFDFTIDNPPAVSATTPANAATGVAASTNLTITFDEPVNVTGNWFQIVCGTQTKNVADTAVTPNGTNDVFTINPTTDLLAGNICQVTVFAAQVTDQDSGDPPDNMAADHTFSFSVPPVATNDTYAPNIVGNVGVNTDNSTEFTILANDIPSDPGLVTTINTSGTSLQGGTVVVASSGKFTYTPPAGYEGADSFTYTITNASGTSNSATVSVNVAGMIWFVNATGAVGDGRLNTPFNSLAAFEAVNGDGGNNPAAGDNIFLFQNATSYVGPVTLLSNQRLIGQDANTALATLAGVTVPADSFPLPTMLPAPGDTTLTKITATGANNAIQLNNAGGNNEIYGLTVGNTVTGAGIFSNPTAVQPGFNTLTIGDVNIDDTGTRTGQALLLTKGTSNGTVNATFGTLEASSAVNGINLTNIGGTININGGSLSALTGADFLVTGGAATINNASTFTITNTTGEGRAVDIQNKTGGTVDFNGLITDTGGQGINLNNNANSAFRFDGGLNLSTGGNNAFVATNDNVTTLAITDPNANGTAPDNTITTGTGTPLNVSLTVIHADDLTFRSISSNGSANGIVLNSTGSSGSLFVTGDSGSTVNSSGGTIQNTTGSAVSLTTVPGGVSLDQVNISNSLGHGIFGTTVTNLSVTNSTIPGAGNGANEFGIFITNLFGTNTINNTSVTNSQTNNLKVSNNSNAATGTLNISNSTFTTTDATNGGDCVNVETGLGGSAQGNLTVNLTDNNDLNTCEGDGIQAAANDNSTLRVTVDGQNSNYNGNKGAAVNIASEGNSQTFALVQNLSNTFVGTSAANGLNVINVQTIESVDSPTMNVTIQNNSVTTFGGLLQNVIGIRVIQEGRGTFNANIKDNTVTGNFATNGVFAQSRAGNGTMNLVVGDSSGSPSNTVTLTNGAALDAVSIEAGSSAGGDTNTICLNMLNNVASSAGAGPQSGYRLRKRATPTFRLQDFPSGTVDNWVNVTKNNTGTTDIVVDAGAFTNAPGPCTVASLPLLAAPDGVEAVEPTAASTLTQDQLSTLSAAAFERWAATGLSAEQLAAMRGMKFELADLPSGSIAEVSGDRIRIDRDADGRGWFVDATPADDAEFRDAHGSRRYTDPAGAPAGRLDLLTALMHEIGHYLNLTDSYAAQSRDDLMYGYLSEGERRLPVTAQAGHTKPGLNGGTHYLSVEPKAEARRAASQAKAKSQPAAKALTPAPAAPVGDLPVTIGTLPAGKSVRVTFEVTVKSAANYTGANAFVSAQGTVTFDDPNNPPTGTLSVQTDDTGTGANTGETDPTKTDVDSQPDLFLSKSDGGATAVPGGTIAYTLTYNNTNGKREAAGVVITETVPANTTFNAGASTGTWNCSPNNNAGSTCTQTIGNLPAGDAGSTTTFAVTVNAAIPAGVTDISNTASIADDGAKGADGNPADNTASDTTPVTAFTDLKITKSDGGVGVQAGNVATYTLSYENIGNQGATGVVITETVPADSTFNSGASTAGWVCAPNNNPGSTCTFNVGAVAAGGSGSVTFAVTTSATPAGTEISNTASIDDDNNNGPDPSGNDSSSDTTPFDDAPTLGTYSDTTVLVTQGTTVSPTAPPADDNPGFDADVTVSGSYSGGATVDDDDGDVHITNAAPAGVYTVTVTVTDSGNQTVVRQFQLTVNKSDTTTALASDNNPSFNNQNVTFTATVTSNTAVTGPPTGTVDFFDGATLICDDAPLNGSGEATCSTSTLTPAGSPHSITATYNGDATFATSTSTVLSQVVEESLNIEVNTLGDAADNNVADEICDTDVAAGEQCTLRAAIETANYVPSSDVITFNSSLNNQTITLDSALPDLGDNPSSGDLEINGPGAALLTVKRDNTAATQFRVFTVPAGKTATISRLTISGGDSVQDGGAVLNQGTLTLDEVVVSDNRTDTLGGGIHNDGTATIKGSTVKGNTANVGGGISNKGTMTVTESTINDNSAANGGGIGTDTTGVVKTLTITNSTISDNRANGSGGGLRVVGTPTTLTNVTIKDNRADNDNNGFGAGGGIFRSSGTVTLRNTIVAENYNDASPSTTADDISGTVTGSFNLIGAGGAGTLVHGVNGNQVGVANPRLGPLADNGGPTRTHALRNNSPALDAGSNTLASNAGLSNDQRGPAFNRIVDSADPGTVATVDIGAFEAQVSIAKIANQGMAEDTALGAFDFEVQEDPGISGFTVTATSSDQTLMPDGNMTLGGSGTTRTMSMTPAANKFGTATITVTVSGMASGTFPVEMTDTFDVTVTPVADTPDAADISMDEDTVSGPIAVVKNPVDGAEVSHFRVTGIAGGKLFMPDGTTQINAGDFIAFTAALPGLRFQPTANSQLPGHFTVRGATGNILPALGTGTDTSTITVGDVNDPPTLGLIAGVNILEDSGATTVNFQNVTAGINESQTLQVTATSSNPALIPNPNVTYTSPDSTGSLSFTPAADGFGTADITVTVKDNAGGDDSVSRTFTVTIANVNDAPTFTKGADETVGEDSGAQTVPNWATSISPGPNEPPEPLGFVITGNTNSALFSVQPAVAPDGTLTYTPATDAVGTAQITLVLKDFRTTENSGANTSAPQTFNITLNAVNDPPTLDAVTDRVINEDSGLQTVNLTGITAGAGETGQVLSVTAASSDTAVIPNPSVTYTSPNATGSLSFTPVANANGPVTITVTVQDNAGGSNSFQRTFLVTVREVNDAPTGVNDALALSLEDTPRTIPFSALTGNDTKGPANENGQALTITNANAPTGGKVTISGTDVIFTPTLDYSGPASFTYTLRDDGTTAGANAFKTSTAQVSFTIKAVNDAPVNKVPGAQTVAKNGKLIFASTNFKRISVSDVDAGTSNVRVTLQATKGTITLASVANLTFVTGDGTDDVNMSFAGTMADVNTAMNGMFFKPTTDYTGAASVKITSSDMGHTPGPALTDSDTVAITVGSVGSQPVAAKAEGSTFQLSAPTYTVSEGALRAKVTVRRTGDIASPAAVSYTTSDLSAVAPCSLANGNASARCDYAVGAGKLRFAAGQSSLSLTIPLVNDAYKEGPENFTLNLAVRKGDAGKLGAVAAATVTIADDDAADAKASPLASDEFFVRQLYLDYLGREPDEAGFASWLGVLKDCAGKDCGREAVASAFFKSQEFRERTHFTFNLYRAALGRGARYDELAPDAARLNSARTDAELLEDKADLVADFMKREEFRARYEAVADADYVDALLVAAAQPNHSQRAVWAAGLADGSLTRNEVLRQFAESDEVSAKFADEAEVGMLYLLLLRRSPDASAGDWGVYMKTHDLRQTFAGFLNSEEYRKRVGP